MSIKYFLVVSTLLLCSCKNISIEGNYNYTKDEREKRVNSVAITYTNKISDIPIVVNGKVNHDPIHRDKPSYQETSIEFWFW